MTQESLPETVRRFSDRAHDYVAYRPSYPAAAIDWILEGLPSPGTLTAVDAGAGTGISARLLGDRGVRVIAVEPGPEMRAAAAPHHRVTWMPARADATRLPDASVDLILCAQSFHWFRPAEVLPEFARILKPGGRLVLMWNRRSPSDPLTAGYREAIAAVGGDAEAEREPFVPGVLAAGGLFADPEHVTVPNTQRLDRDGLAGRARSASYVPKSGPEAGELLGALHDLHARYADADGLVTLVYETDVFRTHAVARPR